MVSAYGIRTIRAPWYVSTIDSSNVKARTRKIPNGTSQLSGRKWAHMRRCFSQFFVGNNEHTCSTVPRWVCGKAGKGVGRASEEGDVHDPCAAQPFVRCTNGTCAPAKGHEPTELQNFIIDP